MSDINAVLSPSFATTASQFLQQQGNWLLQQQPERALPNLPAMQQHFEHCSGYVMQQLKQGLMATFPNIPISRAAFDPRCQEQPEWPVYWVADAIDGAVQYLAGLPLWTITLCLVADGKPQLAVVHEPCAGRTWRAQAGLGADCNGVPLRCAERDSLASATIGTSFPNYPQRPQSEIDDFLARLGRVVPKVFGQRWMGPASLSLAQVGAGKLDGYWEVGRGLYDWLAGALIAQEAGATLTSLDGRPFSWNGDGILAASPPLHSALEGVLNATEEAAKVAY